MKMNKKIIFLSLFFTLLIFNFLIPPTITHQSYGIKDNSEYVWNVHELIANQSVNYQLTARFHLGQGKVNITKQFYSNGSSLQYNMQMSEFTKFIIPRNQRDGIHNYFYTGIGTLKFPRHALTIESSESTQIIDYDTGITLYYTSDLQEHELISGAIPISVIVWIILGITIGLCCASLIFIYKRGKKEYQAIIYSTKNNS
jgi:hypothetical protein